MSAPEPRRGPLVHRSVHHAALLWFVAVMQFLVVMIVVQLGWTNPYNVRTNLISDLGNTGCGPWPSSTSGVVCSHWAIAFDVSVALLGALLVLGCLLIPTAFPHRGTTKVGLALLAIAGAGAIGVGLFPENVNLGAHTAAATVEFLAASLALFPLSLAMFRDTRWDGYRAYTLISGLVAIIAFGLFASGHDFALGPGGMERLIAGPILLWLLLVSIHLLYVPTYAPKQISTGS